MKITILTQYYPPEIGAPQNRLSHLASCFARAGHHVTVLTAMPNYPSGKIREGYGGLLKTEHHEGVRIIRTFILPSKSAALLPRLSNYFSFLFSSGLLGSFLLDRSDYLLVESPPLFLGLAGMWLSRIMRANLIFNVSDLWPASAVHLGVIRQYSLPHRLGLRLESMCYRSAWLITGQSKSILRDIETRFSTKKTFLLSNGADTTLFHPENRNEATRKQLAEDCEFVVLYAGLHGLAQGLEYVIRAAQQLTHEEGYRFVFIGDGPLKQKLVELAKGLGLTNVNFIDPLPNSEVPKFLAASDLILVPLGMHIPGAVPSKLYEAMATGRPVLLVASGEAAEIVHRFKAGIVVTPRDVSALVEAIKTMRWNPQHAATAGEQARLAAVRHFDRTAIAKPFIHYLESRINFDGIQKKEELQAGAGI